jgi:hypothetical protein
MSNINAFAVPLAIYRNREWLQAFNLFNADSTPMDLTGDTLALVVIPATPGASAPLLSNNTPSVTGNKVAFDFADNQTETLTAGTAYTWQFLRRASGNPNSSVMCAGPLSVQESPVFPT